MTLEEQIKKLFDIGITLNEGVTIDHLLSFCPRQRYEDEPFDLIMVIYGFEIDEEPWGRYMCDQVWHFDCEAIYDDGSYTEIVTQFHRITGKAKRIEGLRDSVDISDSHATLHYEVDGVKRTLEPVIDDDWADTQAVATIMEDLCEPGYDFYPVDNGQGSAWFYLTSGHAMALNNLANNIFNLNKELPYYHAYPPKKKPWWKIW
ncbi:hypothetical protein L4C34_05980 [Vibrio profundum]|uniref:hypothetical protein n=1 Tax=Vibrio profundum TaxID=2910247 RepID=UPI003D123E8E